MPNTIANISKRLAQAAISERLDFSVGKSTEALIKSRQVSSYNSDREQYSPSSVIVLNLNSDAFIDPRNSFLLLKFVPGSKHLCLSDHGVFSLIDRVRITLSTGQVIEEIENYSQLMHFLLHWSSDKDFLENFGQVWGHASYRMGSNFKVEEKCPVDASSNTVTINWTERFRVQPYKPPSRGQLNMEEEQIYCIPLSLLGGIFNIKQYLFLKGMGNIKIEIYLNSAAVALKYLGSEVMATKTVSPFTAANRAVYKQYPLQPCKEADAVAARVADLSKVDANSVAGNLNPQGYQEYDFDTSDPHGIGAKNYRISGIQLVLENIQVNDANTAVLESELANNSLVHIFDTWFCSTTPPQNGDTMNYNLTKAAYCVKSLFFLFKDQARTQNFAFDSVSTIPLKQILKTFQIQVGSTPIPIREIQSTAEAFTHSRRAFNLLHTSDLSSVSLEEYENGDKGLIGLSMEKDDTAPLTGMPTIDGVAINVRVKLKNPDNYWTKASDSLTALPSVEVRNFMLYTRLFVYGANPAQHLIYE